MSVADIIFLFRNCTINFKSVDSDEILCVACVFFYGVAPTISFRDLRIEKSSLLSSVITDICVTGVNTLDIYLD